MNNKNINTEFNDIMVELEKLKAENIVDVERLNEKAEEEKRIITELLEKENNKNK